MSLKDQVFHAVEKGDYETTKKLIETQSSLQNEVVSGMSLREFAARQGQYEILLLLKLPEDKQQLYKLLEYACIDGHKEAIALIMQGLSKHFDFLDLQAKEYTEILEMVPERAKNSVYFPYVWERIKGVLFAYKQGKLQKVPVKKICKYLI